VGNADHPMSPCPNIFWDSFPCILTDFRLYLLYWESTGVISDTYLILVNAGTISKPHTPHFSDLCKVPPILRININCIPHLVMRSHLSIQYSISMTVAT